MVVGESSWPYLRHPVAPGNSSPMRKRILSPTMQDMSLPEEDWVNLEQVARVDVSSEDAAHPIESALLPGSGTGWRAAGAGAQTIRLIFDQPQRLKRISLIFVETE